MGWDTYSEQAELLNGLMYIMDKALCRFEAMHEQQIAVLNNISNQLQFISEDIENRQPRDLMEGVL
jgi:hypothetical protein